MNNVIIIFILGVISLQKAFTTEVIDKENYYTPPKIIKNGTPSSFTLPLQLKLIEDQITQGHRKGSSRIINNAYKSFMKLTLSPQEWEQAAKLLKAQSWPFQKASKETVGGHLFYPRDVHALLDSPYTEFMLLKPDMLRCLEVSANFHHTLGLYYLAYTLDIIYFSSPEGEKPQGLKEAYYKALNEMQEVKNNPDVFYILGRNYTEDSYKTKALKINPKLGYDIHINGHDARNKFAALTVREKMKGFEDPTFQEYEEISREGYGPAYIKLSTLSDSFEKKLEYLEKANASGFMPALIDIGLLYANNGNLKEAANYFLKAGQKGIAEGYINLGTLKVGNILLSRQARERLITQVSQEEIQEAISLFQLAGNLNYAKAWDYLAVLNIELFKQTLEISYSHKLRSALVKGSKLGSLKAYELMETFFPEEFSSMPKPLHQKLYARFSKIIN